MPSDASQTPDSNPFDMPGLMARCLNDEAFARSMVRLFIQQIPELFTKLDAAIISGDREKIAVAAHGVKGTAGNAGAKHVEAVAFDIETIAKTSNEVGLIERKQKELRDAFAVCERHVEAMKSE